MGILLRIVGVLWCAAGTLIMVGAAMGTLAGTESGDRNAAYNVGVFVGAGLVLTPIWLTGIAFFLLPGWIRKQVSRSPAQLFA
ncbi:MAG: hypothetical protein FP825_10400 [Hyphomonas sp.]|uniref:hypothetical protein n=1 Tax=Hyphomonas sp. TaxID=87 RepID=UPI0018583345|nr:hypothetical protein [Hyphomonas sp.]MBA3068880.1 hypothetical protein [Hyphomonas sp.]MBU3920381.1 hypothetical protein [Alphaproteobacteria bacterium]MBU4062908.1 hypothetical protein [Alphaproteobacteria bacterium]MBU4165440.1 hypothetical protein [Alphaproteobacteria bacterium]